jgi:hypothetical protein
MTCIEEIPRLGLRVLLCHVPEEPISLRLSWALQAGFMVVIIDLRLLAVSLPPDMLGSAPVLA